MDFKIEIKGVSINYICFEIFNDRYIEIYSNIEISKLLKIPLDEYLKRLRKNFKIDGTCKISFLIEEMERDEMIKKFKEEFSNELILLKLKDSIQF